MRKMHYFVGSNYLIGTPCSTNPIANITTKNQIRVYLMNSIMMKEFYNLNPKQDSMGKLNTILSRLLLEKWLRPELK